MSIRRPTGRDRRGGAIAPVPEDFYAKGANVRYIARGSSINAGSPTNLDRVSSWAHAGTRSGWPTLTQGTGASQPRWVASATPNGSPAVEADTASRYVFFNGVTDTPATASTTIFVVCSLTANGPFASFSNVAQTAGWRVRATTGNIDWLALGGTALTDGATPAGWKVLAYRIAASGGFGTAVTTSELYINGVLQAALTGSTNYLQPTTYCAIFSGASGATGQIADVQIAPATALSAADTIACSQALMRQYGIS